MQQLQHVQKRQKGNADPPATPLAFELLLETQHLMFVHTLFKAPHFLRKDVRGVWESMELFVGQGLRGCDGLQQKKCTLSTDL